MIKRKLKDALRETKVKIHGVPFIHRISENKFDSVETWVRADGHGTIRKTDEGKFVARYEKWNDIAKKYETRVIESKDEIEEVVDQMNEDIKEGELKKKAREEGRKRMMGDAKAEGKAVWVMREDEDFWRPWGLRDWTEEELEGYRDKFKEKGYKKVILVENDGTDPNKTMIHDDYGWEIPADKALDAFESVKEELGANKLLLSLQFAMGTDDVKEAVKDIAADWDEETDDIDELVELAGEDDVLDAIAQWLSYDDLADDLAFICRMNDLHIPELKEEDEIEVDEDIDVDDALWSQPDNNAGSAGILTKTPAIRYKDYLILTREDGMYDVYTRHDFDLVGTEFKSVEEAKKNIDEGRKGEHVKTEVEEDFDEDEDEETIETEEEVEEMGEETESDEEIVKPDPDRKQVSFAKHNIVKQEDGTWTILYGGGLNVAARKPVAKGLRSFQEAVKWIFDNVKIQEFPNDKTATGRLIMKYMPAEFKDSTNAVTKGDVKIGLVFAYSINPRKHFEVIGNTATDAHVVVKNPKGELEIMATEDLVHDINNGDLILVSKGE